MLLVWFNVVEQELMYKFYCYGDAMKFVQAAQLMISEDQ